MSKKVKLTLEELQFNPKHKAKGIEIIDYRYNVVLARWQRHDGWEYVTWMTFNELPDLHYGKYFTALKWARENFEERCGEGKEDVLRG
jgi:hypothetical protein